MGEVKALIGEIETLHREAQALVRRLETGEATAEERAKLDQLLAELEQKRARVLELERDEARRKAVAETEAFLSAPQYRLPRGMLDDRADSVKALLRAGWDCKAGIVFAPTSTGRAYPMWPEDVLFGTVPDDPEGARFYLTTRAAMQPTYEQAFRRWIGHIARSRSEGQAFLRLSEAEQKALSEGTDSAGGVLVPPQLQAELLMRKAQTAVVRSLVGAERVVTTTRDRVIWPRVQPASGNNASIYSSGFIGSWVGETPVWSDVDPAFGTFEVSVKKIRAATKLSNDWLADATANPLAFLATNGAQNLALTEDQAFLAGTGAANEPLGILNGLTTSQQVDVEGSTADTISNTTTNAGSAPKIIDLAYALPSQYADAAVFLMRRAVEGKVRKLVDGQGRYHWPDTGFGATPRQLLGYPVRNSEFMPNDGTNGNKVLLFGDFASGYLIVERAQVTVVVLRERFADTDQTGFVLFARVGGGVYNPDAFRVGVV